jgi:hypothetical protein
MVERVRNGIGFLIAILLELVVGFIHNPQDDETPDEDAVTAIHEGQRTQIAPPRAPTMSIGHRFINAGPQDFGGLIR